MSALLSAPGYHNRIQVAQFVNSKTDRIHNLRCTAKREEVDDIPRASCRRKVSLEFR
jgi:hypothetical protein